VLAGKLHQLAALRLLSDGLSKLEEHRLKRIECGDKVAPSIRDTIVLSTSLTVQVQRISGTNILRKRGRREIFASGSLSW